MYSVLSSETLQTVRIFNSEVQIVKYCVRKKKSVSQKDLIDRIFGMYQYQKEYQIGLNSRQQDDIQQ